MTAVAHVVRATTGRRGAVAAAIRGYLREHGPATAGAIAMTVLYQIEPERLLRHRRGLRQRERNRVVRGRPDRPSPRKPYRPRAVRSLSDQLVMAARSYVEQQCKWMVRDGILLRVELVRAPEQRCARWIYAVNPNRKLRGQKEPTP